MTKPVITPGTVQKPKLPEGTIVMHFMPKDVLIYVRQWAASIKKSDQHSEAEKAMAEDIATMVAIASKNMTRIAAPTESETTKQSNNERKEV